MTNEDSIILIYVIMIKHPKKAKKENHYKNNNYIQVTTKPSRRLNTHIKNKHKRNNKQKYERPKIQYNPNFCHVVIPRHEITRRRDSVSRRRHGNAWRDTLNYLSVRRPTNWSH